MSSEFFANRCGWDKLLAGRRRSFFPTETELFHNRATDGKNSSGSFFNPDRMEKTLSREFFPSESDGKNSRAELTGVFSIPVVGKKLQEEFLFIRGAVVKKLSFGW